MMETKKILGLVATLMLGAPYMVLANEKAEQPEVDPSGNQPPPQQYQQPSTPAPYPVQDGASGFPSQPDPNAAPSYPPQGGYAAPSYPPQGAYNAAPSDAPQDSYNAAPSYPPQNGGFAPSYPGAYPPEDGAPQYQPAQAPTAFYGSTQYTNNSGSPFYANQNYNHYGFAGQTSYTGYGQPQSYNYPQFGPPGAMLHPRVATAPAGLTINVSLQTAISTQVAKDGDFVQASISQNVPLSGLSYIPSGSVITGQVTEAKSGRMMNRSGSLGVEFNKLQLPDGQSVQIQAHVLGDIGKYAPNSKDGEYHGEGWGTKIGQFALRSAIGAGSGAALGTALGAITGRVGTGAWAGTAIGGGLGVVDDLFLRRGRNVLIQSGTPMQIQLDAPVQVPVEIQPQYGAS